MKTKVKNPVSGQYLLSGIVVTAILLIQLSFTISGDNLIYAIGEIRTYDGTLFHNNVYMSGGVISPRFITDLVFALLMHMNGGNWSGAALIWVYFGLIIETLAIVNLAGKISKEYVPVYSAIIALLFAYNQNALAGFLLTALGSTSIGPGLAFAMLSVSFAFGEKKNYKFAWIFAGCSAICHIHEGIYCYVVIFIIACVDSIVEKRIKIKENLWIIFAVAALMLVVMPDMLTDKMNISNSEFVYIYSIYRHPHHLVPSRWGLENIAKSFAVNVSLFLLVLEAVYLTRKEETKRILLEAGFLLTAWIGALGLAYIFTERFPLAIVSTMFIPKSFKFVALMAVIYVVYALKKLRDEGKILSGYLILFYAFMTCIWSIDQMCLYFLVFAVIIALEFKLHKEDGISSQALIFCDAAFFFAIYSARFFTLNLYAAIKILAVFAVLGFVHLVTLYRKKFIAVSMVLGCVLMLAVSGFRVFYIRKDGKFIVQTGENALRLTMGNGLYILAEEFEKMTDADDVFLADPADTVGAGWFQVACKRNCYVLEKVVPSSKCTVKEWYERCTSLKDFSSHSPEEIKDIMNKESIGYALIRKERFSEFDDSKDYKAVLSSPDDSYRIYQIR